MLSGGFEFMDMSLPSGVPGVEAKKRLEAPAPFRVEFSIHISTISECRKSMTSDKTVHHK